jgi:hypothetical protein
MAWVNGGNIWQEKGLQRRLFGKLVDEDHQR